MSSGIVKKARGRPPKSKTASMTPLKSTSISVPVTAPDIGPDIGQSNRKSGRMSLRPNRKVKLFKGDPEDFSDDDYDDISEPVDDDVADPSIVAKIENGSDEDDDDDEDEPMTKKSRFSTSILPEDEINELQNRDVQAGPRRSRPLVLYNPKLAAAQRKRELDKTGQDNPTKIDPMKITYAENRDWYCVACSTELDPNKLNKYTDIFQGLTKNGKSLKDFLTSVIKENLDESMIGTKICNKCVQELNNIEDLYVSFRHATDNFLDKYIIGQKSLDADLSGLTQIEDLSNLVGALNLSLQDVVIKVLDNNLEPFNHTLIAEHQDFGCPPSRMYLASFVNETSMPESTEDRNQIIVTFDYATGTISRTDNLFKAQLNPEDLDNSKNVILYLTESEFENLKKVPSEDRLCLSIEEFARLNPMVLLGHKSTYLQILLSSHVSDAYRSQIPSAHKKFVCADCGASFHHMHMLTNHIQSVHVDDQDPIEVQENPEKPKEIQEEIQEDPTRTGEIATLEKPFQCEHCDKCFGDYHNFSNHVEHYHGFSRKCNVPECETVCKSIQEFVQHYVQHTEPNFVLPSEFKAKTQIALPCPQCHASMNGIWRFYNHTFCHDPVPRFRCPVCNKRLAKVQNFKDHIMKKHMAPPTSQKSKFCTSCNQLIPQSSFAKHMKEFHEKVHQQFQCPHPQCTQTFAKQAYLNFHVEKHIPKSEWVWFCRLCAQPFPSEARLKSHELSSHQNDAFYCRHCDLEGINSRLDLADHILQTHSKIYGCSNCPGIRELSVLAVREHYRTVHAELPFKCHKCESSFDSMIGVHAHVSTHHDDMIGVIPDANETNKEENACCICGMVYKNVSTLIHHLRVKHLSVALDITSKESYDKVAPEFGNHIIEYEAENSDKITKIHSVL